MALKPTISREMLKQKVGDKNIFNFYFGDFSLDRSYNSIFRQDDKPSTGFYVSEHDSLIYNDFTTGDKYDFVHFVMKLHGLPYYKALELIAVDFGLLPGERSTTKPAIIKKIEAAKIKKIKNYVITVNKFKKQDLDYWAQYHITEKELTLNGVKPVSGMDVNGYEIPMLAGELRYLYIFTENDNKYFKIYSPYSIEYKWVGNVPLHVPFGLDKLEYQCDTLIITKSVKDLLVLRKFFPDVIALQNESKSSIKREVLEELHKHYNIIVLWFDPDKAGKAAADWYKKQYPWLDIVFTPDQCYTKHGIKDPSDFVKHYGLEVFEMYLKSLNL